MPKVYLSPAYHKWNACSISGCDETTHNNLYLDELEVYLKANNIEFKRGTRRVPKSNEDGETLMINAVKQSNAYKPDIHYVSHTNAFNGTVRGYRPIIYPTGNAKGEKLAEIMIKYRKEIYSQPINLKRRDDLYELYATNSVAYYEEHVFHDNKADAQWFHNNMRRIAEQTCKAFCEYFGIKFVDPYAKKEEPKVEEPKVEIIYKVRKSWEDSENQVGAYKILQNAIAKAQETECNVYDNNGKVVWEYKPEKVEEKPTEEPPVVEEKPNTEIEVEKNSILKALKHLLKLILEWIKK